MTKTSRSMIFGSEQTVAQHAGNPRVQAHGPGFSKIMIGDDVVDDWQDYLDLMVESVISNSGRSCINCSGIWASRHTREISEAIAKRKSGTAKTKCRQELVGLDAVVARLSVCGTQLEPIEETACCVVEPVFLGQTPPR